MSSISGKIINHDTSFFGEIYFNNEIEKITKDINVGDNIIIPGYVDLHCHGGNGFDTMDGSESIKKMASYHLNKGTTTLLATTWTNTLEYTYKALTGFNNLINNDSNLIGVHLEGPFINPNKLGAQPPLTQKPSIAFIEKIMAIANIKVITLAPEIEDMENFIPYLIDNKIKVQFGHSLADYFCCKKYMEKFNIGFTHLYNAMSGNDHRAPGVLSAALLEGEYAEIICDLHHVKAQAIQLASKCIPSLYAVTDSVGAAGLEDGNYKFANVDIKKEFGQITIRDSSTLAGSIIDMHQTFLNLLSLGNYSIEEVVSMTSYNASKYLGLNDIGKIAEGYKSNFLVLDKNFNLKQVYLNGKKIIK